jgi:hypothetical protein
LVSARCKIKRKAEIDCAALKGNLSLVLDHFLDAHGVKTIGWASQSDSVEPAYVLDLLAGKLVEAITAAEYERFLEKFSDQTIELAEQERRAQ